MYPASEVFDKLCCSMAMKLPENHARSGCISAPALRPDPAQQGHYAAGNGRRALSVDGPTQTLFDIHPFVGPNRHVFGVEVIAIAPFGLGALHRHVGRINC